MAARVWGNYLELGARQAGEKLEVSYSVPVSDEEVTIGNPGFRQYRYRVTWKGDTVVGMTPIGEQVTTAFSDFDSVTLQAAHDDSRPRSRSAERTRPRAGTCPVAAVPVTRVCPVEKNRTTSGRHAANEIAKVQ